MAAGPSISLLRAGRRHRCLLSLASVLCPHLRSGLAHSWGGSLTLAKSQWPHGGYTWVPVRSAQRSLAGGGGEHCAQLALQLAGMAGGGGGLRLQSEGLLPSGHGPGGEEPTSQAPASHPSCLTPPGLQGTQVGGVHFPGLHERPPAPKGATCSKQSHPLQRKRLASGTILGKPQASFPEQTSHPHPPPSPGAGEEASQSPNQKASRGGRQAPRLRCCACSPCLGVAAWPSLPPSLVVVSGLFSSLGVT